MKRDIRKTKRTRNRKFPLAVCLFSIAYALSGCGGENAAPEELTSDYVYVAQQLATSPSGGYSLPEGFGNPAVEGGQLYYMRNTYESPAEGLQVEEGQMLVASHAVERVVFPEDSSAVDFAGAEVLFSVSAYSFEKDKGGAGSAVSEDEILAMLDTAMDEESSPVKPGLNGFIMINSEKDYFRFNIRNYTVDQEQNLYFVLDCSLGDYYAMESLGTVLCKRTAEGEWAYRHFFSGLEPSSLAVDGKGGVYLLTAEGILAVDRDGHETGMTSTEEFKGKRGSSERLLGDSRGNVYYFVLEADNSCWKGLEVVPQGGKGLKEVEGLSGSDWLYNCTVFHGNVFFSSASGVFYEYGRETESSMEILQWTNSGLIDSNIRDCIVLEKEKLLVWYDEPGMEGLYLLDKTPVDELPERKFVVLAAFEAPIAVENAVVRFNRLNKEYQVVLENYGYSYETASGAQTRLNAALSSSTPPDLLYLSGRDLKKDMEKGLLEDLSPWLENSSILDREDFLKNALEGYTIEGCLVGIPVHFRLTAVGGRTSQVGGLDSWTMEDVYALAERYPEQTLLLSDATYDEDTGKDSRELVTREHLLGKFCADWYLEEYVDWKEGKCNFHTEGFRRLLRWVGEHSEEPPADSRSQIIYLQGYLPKEALLMETYIDFNTASSWEIQCGENITLTGFPTADGKGTVSLHVEAPLGIVAGAENREGHGSSWNITSRLRRTKNGLLNCPQAKPGYRS